MLGIVLLISCVWWGIGLLRIFRTGLRGAERVVAGTIVGLVTGFWVVYLVTYAAGGLKSWVPTVCLAFFVLAGLASRSRLISGAGTTSEHQPSRDGWLGWTAAALGAALVWMNLRGVLAEDRAGDLLAAEHIWADTPFHASIITSFAHRDNIPPHYPLALGAPLEYPFMIDFASAVLVRGGLSLRWSIVALNLVVQLSFFCAVALVARRVTGSRRAAVLGTVVLFSLGNFGFFAIPVDLVSSRGIGDWFRHLPWSYTGDALGDPGRERLGTGLYLGNPTFMFLLPRRSGAFGLAAGAGYLLLLEDLVRRRRLGTAALAGVLLGAMPRVHAHTVMACIAFGAAGFLRAGPRRALPAWSLMGGVAAALALPQAVSISRQATGFVDWWWGWTGEPHDARNVGRAVLETARFWWYNAGLGVALLAPALVRGGRKIAAWYAPFAVLWIFGNLVRTQPWEWDNVNHFVWWQVGTTIVVCAFLAEASRRQVWRVLAAFAVAGLTFGGLLSFVFAAQQRLLLWTEGERRIAEWVRDNTPRDAVILTSTGEAHNHPVNALSGRQVYVGWQGWLFAHGLDWEAYDIDVERMYSGNVELIKDVGIDFVVIGPYERGYADSFDLEISERFDDPEQFRQVLNPVIDGEEWRVLEVVK